MTGSRALPVKSILFLRALKVVCCGSEKPGTVEVVSQTYVALLA
jgi:hypothetical protein